MTCRQRYGSRSFTLVEVVLFVAVLSVIASAGYVALVSTREAAQESKLVADTAHVNEMLQIYMANGGGLPAEAATQASSGTMVVTQLKSRADAASAAKTMGLKTSVLDARVVAVPQTTEEAATDQPRAVWEPSEQRFKVVRAPGTVGIKEFRLDEALATEISTAARDPGVLNVATNSQWVWDYNETVPETVATGGLPETQVAPTYPNNPSATVHTLQAPTVPDGPYPLSDFPKAITLTNPNPSGVSQLYSSAGGGTLTLYRTAFTVEPGTGIAARAVSVDPDHYLDSVVNSGTPTAIPVDLVASLTGLGSMTYAQAGGAMTTQTTTALSATVSLSQDTLNAVPAAYRTRATALYSYGSGVAPTLPGTEIPLSLDLWGSGTSLVVNAYFRSDDTTLLHSSAVVSGMATIAKTALSPPAITPVSGQRAADLPVTIALASGQAYPVGARIYYTTDGGILGATASGEATSSGTTAPTLYSAPFQPGAGTNGVVTVNAAVYAPAGYGAWFTPSSQTQVTYTSPATTPDGVLVGSANIYGSSFVGSIIYARPAAGQTMSDISFTQGASIQKGNLYLPGTPNIYNGYIGDAVKWTLPTDGSFASRIYGKEYTAEGVEVVGNPSWSVSPRVIDLGKTTSASTGTYSLVFYNNSYIEGKVYRQNDPPSLPTVAAPPSKDSNNTLDYGTYRLPPSGGLSASTVANATLNSGTAPLKLLPGNFGSLTANNGTTIQLGNASNPEVTQYYTAESLGLNGGSKLVIVGKVVITLKTKLEINNGSVVGNSAHPDWLTLSFYTASTSTPVMFAANSGSKAYAAIVAPNGEVDLNNGSTFNGSIAAKKLQITSASVAFSIPPVIAQ